MGRRLKSITNVVTLPRGVSLSKDASRHRHPYCMRHRKLPREFFATAELAVARKRELIELEATHGTEAISYSRAVHADATTAMDLLPDSVSLVDASRFYLLHHPTSATMLVREAVDLFVDAKHVASGKSPEETSTRHVRDLRIRLAVFVGDFGERALVDLQGNEVLAWLLDMAAAPRTRANFRMVLQNLFNFALRRGWLVASPMAQVAQEDLPAVRGGRKHPMTVAQAQATMALIAAEWPQYRTHYALRFYLGFRTAEAERFRWEWIQPTQKRVIIPGWVYSPEGAESEGSKTGDTWAIDDIPPAFWRAYKATPGRADSGAVPKPYNNRWEKEMRPAIIKKLGLKAWPHNAARDTFCTLHMSAYRSAERTALVLKHTNSQTLWRSYLGELIPQAQAAKFFK